MEDDEIPFSDTEILNALTELEAVFKAGERMALWRAIKVCATQQAVMPDWVVDQIEAIAYAIDRGRIRGFDEAFGFRPVDRRRRAREQRKRKFAVPVTQAIYLEWTLGRAIDTALFDELGERFSMSRRGVEECYKEGLKHMPKEQWKKPQPGVTVGVGHVTFRAQRRRGRSIL